MTNAVKLTVSRPAPRSRADYPIEDSRELLRRARRASEQTRELIEQARVLIAESHRLTSEQESATAVTGGSRREMAQRHVAEQRARIANQQALIARATAHGHPAKREKDLLSEMEGLHEGMCAELKDASDDK